MTDQPARSPLMRLLAVVLLLGALAILASLGTWQAGRFIEKRNLFALMDERLAEPRLPISTASQLTAETDYRQVRLTGGTLQPDKTVVIERRFHKKMPGHWLFTPYAFADGSAVIVQTGWIPEGRPELVDALPATLEGLVLTTKNEHPDELARRAADFKLTGKPRMGEPDTNFLYQQLGSSPPRPATLVVLTTDVAPGVFPRPAYEHITNPYLTPATHFGYAVLWYGSGLLLVWLFWAGWTGRLDPRRKA